MADEQVEVAAPGPISRDALISQLDGLDEDAPAEAAPAETDEDEGADAEEVEAAGDVSDADAEDDSEESDEESDEEKPDDPKTQKGLDAVRRAEKRYREQMAADRAEFAREQAKHADRIARLDEYESLAKRAKYDPIPVLKALGLTEDDFEMAAHAIFAESKAGAADPARKASAAVRLREREKEDKLTAAEKRMEALEAKMEADKLERENAAHAERYIGEINAAAKTKFPLVAHMMTATPEDIADGLSAAFDRLKAKTGQEPKPSEVVAEMDRKERARLKAIGIDPDVVIKSKPIAAKKAVKVNGAPRSANSGAPKTRDEILAELDQLDA